MDERVPGAVVVPGFDEEIVSRHNENESYANDVERGDMTIDMNANVLQAPTINVDPPKIGGFWHATRGRLVIAALIFVIAATAIGVTLALVLEPELNQLESTPVPPTTRAQTHENTSTPIPRASLIENGNCSNALPLPVDGMVTVGSNVNGTNVSACGTGYYGRGAWYRFIGNGRRITVSTCNEKTTTDVATVLSVLSSKDGTCGDDKLVCNKTASGYASPYSSGCTPGYTGTTVSIDTVLSSSYYASVIGYEDAVGEFGLAFFDDGPASRRILPKVSAPALVNEDIGDQTDGSFTDNKRMDHLHSIKD
jgi:hypothetical protein